MDTTGSSAGEWIDHARTFYFKSIGHEFFALSKPLSLLLGMTFKV